MMRIAKMIRVTRTIDGMSQIALSEQIGIPRSAIRRIEAGKSVDIETALKIMAWLFEAEDTTDPDLNERLL